MVVLLYGSGQMLTTCFRLSDDTLLTHSAPAILRGDDDNTSSIVSEVNFDSSRDELESGTIMLWRWLGLDRFFPPGWEPQTRFSGCSSVRVLPTIHQHILIVYY